MWLNAVAFLSVIGMAVYIKLLVNRYREKLTCMTAMMIAMTSAMMTSTLFGTVLGILIGDMLVPTVAAVLAGMAVGYITGKPVSLMAAMDGMMSGIMGGMMGAMLGVMVYLTSPRLMVAFMTAVTLVILVFLVRMIREEVGEETKAAEEKGVVRQERRFFAMRTGFPKFVWFVFPFFLLLLFVFLNTTEVGQTSTPANSGAETNVETADAGTAGNGVANSGRTGAEAGKEAQEVDVTVKKDGYWPEEIKVKAGAPVKLNLKKDYEGGCLSYILIKDFKISKPVNPGTTTVEIPPQKPGRYPFTCGMKMYGGTIVVEP